MRLELRGITKRFGALVANDSIDLIVEPGEIHALLGENGAGKSTLMNVLYGLYQPDEGEILVDGEPVTFNGPGDAIAAGIGMVHQHFMLIPVFTVAENVVLGHEQHGGSASSTAGGTPRGARGLRALRARGAPDALVAGPPGRRPAARRDRQGAGARRPGAHPRRADRGADPAGDRRPDRGHAVAREGGTSIVFITHKLREVRAIADRITVIRRGKVVGEASPTVHLGRARLADGRPPGQARRSTRKPAQPGDRDPRGGQSAGRRRPTARSPSTT